MSFFPKVIYQTWYTKKLSYGIQSTIDNMMEMNPNYEHRLFDDNDMTEFIEATYSQRVLNCFNKLAIGASKADLWRYLVLFRYGGIYIDMDSMIIANLDSLIRDDSCSIISRERNHGLFVQWCLFFMPESPILRECIVKCLNNIESKKLLDITELTGPKLYSSVIQEFYDDPDIYSASDESISSDSSVTHIRCHGFDYDGYAGFCNPYRDDLYKSKKSWRDQQNNNFSNNYIG